MDLFKTDLVRVHPPQRNVDRSTYRSRRTRFGCRSVWAKPSPQPLAAAVRLALALPIAAVSQGPESTAEAA
jgi:hypothetical protein